jgi:hypothetical protein
VRSFGKNVKKRKWEKIVSLENLKGIKNQIGKLGQARKENHLYG